MPIGSRCLPAARGRLGAAIATIVLLATAMPGLAAQDRHAWKTYVNDRFGFSVCYPADLVRPEPAPDNDDGRTFKGANGETIAAWGSWNALDWSVADSARQDEERLAGGSGTITYKTVRKGFYVISGRRDGQIFYNRTVLANGTFTAVEVTYPASDRALWDAIAARVSRCLRPG